jgi:hypothetical protein
MTNIEKTLHIAAISPSPLTSTLQDLATLPNPLPPAALPAASLAQPALPPLVNWRALHPCLNFLAGGYSVHDCCVEDLLDADPFFRGALHVFGAHLVRYGLSLCLCYGRETLRAQEVDAGLVVAKIRFQADQNYGHVGEEVQDFGVPL